jgi:hypothetical protein
VTCGDLGVLFGGGLIGLLSDSGRGELPLAEEDSSRRRLGDGSIWTGVDLKAAEERYRGRETSKTKLVAPRDHA